MSDRNAYPLQAFTGGEFVTIDGSTLRTIAGTPLKAGDLAPGRVYHFDPATLRLLAPIGEPGEATTAIAEWNTSRIVISEDRQPRPKSAHSKRALSKKRRKSTR